MDDRRQYLHQQINILREEFHRQAKPYVDRLAALEALRMPSLVVDRAMLEQFAQKPPPMANATQARQGDDANARILRLESENTRLVQLLRLVDGAPSDLPLPSYLRQQIKAARRDVGE